MAEPRAEDTIAKPALGQHKPAAPPVEQHCLAIPGASNGMEKSDVHREEESGGTAHVTAKFDRSVTRRFLEVDSILEELNDLQYQNEDDPSKSRNVSFSSFSVHDSWLWHQVVRLRSFLRQLVQHRSFDGIIAVLILFHAIYIGLETEFQESSDFVLKWYLAEAGFTFLFFVEFLLRMAAAKPVWEFLRDGWTLFDLVLVSTSCIDTFLVTFISRSGSGSIVAAFRTVRLVRVVRMLRLLRFFREMWALVAGIVEAMWTLFWTWILLLVIIYVCGIFATRTIGQPNRSESELQRYFGNVARSMFTLFQVTTTEGWAEIARQAMRVSPWTAAFFVIYLYVTTCAVLNVVVAVIVENTLDQATGQREKFNAKQDHSQREACARMYQIFHSLDDNGDGMLTKLEFSEALGNAEICRYLHTVGLDMRQAEELFSILDFDDSGSLDAQEFVGGVLKAVGPSKAREVLALHCDMYRSKRKVSSKVKAVHRQTISHMKTVHRGVRDLRTEVQNLTKALAEAHGSGNYAHSSQPSAPSQLPPLAGSKQPSLEELPRSGLLKGPRADRSPDKAGILRETAPHSLSAGTGSSSGSALATATVPRLCALPIQKRSLAKG